MDKRREFVLKELRKFSANHERLDNEALALCTLDLARELCQGYGFSMHVAAELAARVVPGGDYYV